MATITDKLLTDSDNRTFDISTVYSRTDGSYVVTLRHPQWGDVPYQAVEGTEVWEAIDGWKADNPDCFEAGETEAADETEEEAATEAETDALADFRETKLKKLAERFTHACENAYIDSSLGFRADADADSSRAVADLIDLLEGAGDDTVVQFCDADNDRHNLCLAQLKTLRQEIIENACSLRTQKWAYRDAIEDAESVAELKAIKLKFTYMSFGDGA